MKLTNEIVIEKAFELGFDLVGFSQAGLLNDEAERLKIWLDNGYQASMEYMSRNLNKRVDVTEILPGAKSIISLAMNYHTPYKHSDEEGFGKVSRYAWGKDYHLIIWDKLELLEEELRKFDDDFISMSYVDTGPVMDKAWAVHSGIGWMGKHSNIINREFGSWFFIATVITNQEFIYNKPVTDLCGTCTACIEACPTNAIVEDYIVDSNKCISFLTIENKGEIGIDFFGKFDNWIFGCDICQDVCPWNKKFSQNSREINFEPVNKSLNLSEIREMNADQFKIKFETSPIKRAKLSGLKRNAQFLVSNK